MLQHLGRLSSRFPPFPKRLVAVWAPRLSVLNALPILGSAADGPLESRRTLPSKRGWWRAWRPRGRSLVRLAASLDAAWRLRHLPNFLLASGWDPPHRWRRVLQGKWRWPAEHISINEARTGLLALRHLARHRDVRGHRALFIGDNLAAVCAYEKGRGRAWTLNSLARRAAAYQIGLGIQWRHRHIQSERNVADAGSRGRSHLAPSASPATATTTPTTSSTPAAVTLPSTAASRRRVNHLDATR